MPELVDKPPLGTAKIPAEIKREPATEIGNKETVQMTGDQKSQFTGGVRCIKGLIISCRKAGANSAKPLEVQTIYCGRNRTPIYMAPSDIKNWTDQKSQPDPSELVGEYVMVHLAGGIMIHPYFLDPLFYRTSSSLNFKMLNQLIYFIVQQPFDT